jgi:hypothetical protein
MRRKPQNESVDVITGIVRLTVVPRLKSLDERHNSQHRYGKSRNLQRFSKIAH